MPTHEDAIDNIEYSIQASASRTDDLLRVLKHGETFAVFDHHGDIKPAGRNEQGIYHEGTRFLSQLEFRLFGERPTLLSSTVKEDNALIVVDLTNPAFYRHGKVAIASGTLHIFRGKLLWNGFCNGHLRITNHGLTPLTINFGYLVDADFVDIFEIRGMRRPRRGQRLGDVIDEDSLVLAYEGLDKIIRRTHVTCSPRPREVRAGQILYEATLAPGQSYDVYLTIQCVIGEQPPAPITYQQVWERVNKSLDLHNERACRIVTSNGQFNNWLTRSYTDLFMMTTETDYGPYPFAGVPWFSTVFGRDGLITALESLWINPGLARGVLNYLAANQATSVNPEQDAEPGKILHETRKGEMAALGEIPFGAYYGSVDSTPLFIMLAAAYYDWTDDRAFIEAIWPNIEAALEWIERYGDADGDGFVEYKRQTPEGLVQQGWKDSGDSIMHHDGRLADPPIALCEVQSYVYAALRGARRIAHDLGHTDRARVLGHKARHLKKNFEEAFWCEELQTYALALDGEKRQCRVNASNAGHTLLSGLIDPERARLVAQKLLAPEMFTGWGIRTLAAGEARYNPMSYHNGSVWPHDNALIAAGLAQYGLMDETLQVMNAFHDLSQWVDLHRLPELLCGFQRRPHQAPILYPVACAPQAWATASVFMLLQSCLGLKVNAQMGQVSLHHSVLPPFLDEVEIKNLRVGTGHVDLICYRYAQNVGINVTNKEGDIEVITIR